MIERAWKCLSTELHRRAGKPPTRQQLACHVALLLTTPSAPIPKSALGHDLASIFGAWASAQLDALSPKVVRAMRTGDPVQVADAAARTPAERTILRRHMRRQHARLLRMPVPAHEAPVAAKVLGD